MATSSKTSTSDKAARKTVSKAASAKTALKTTAVTAAPKAQTASRDSARKNVIAALNKARAMELYAITQYMNQHYALDDMNYGTLAADMKRIAIDEMTHAEKFAERIKELGGDPATERDGKIERGLDVTKLYSFDSNVEIDTIAEYNNLLKICRDNGDSVSARVLEAIIEDEQVHQSYFDNIAGHIQHLGAAYLSHIAGTSASIGASTKGFTATQGAQD